MKRQLTFRTTLYVTSFFLIWGLLAQEKMKINVQCRMSGEEFRVTYTDKRPQIEDMLNDSIKNYLNQRIPFFDFVTGEPETDSLIVHVFSKDVSPLDEIKLNHQFNGENVVPKCEALKWDLSDDAHPVEEIKYRDINKFVASVMDRYRDLFREDEFIDRFFRNRMLTKELIEEIEFDTKQWILVFTFDELPLGHQSELKFTQKYEDAASGSEFKTFFARVIGDKQNLIKTKLGIPSGHLWDAAEASPGEEFTSENFKEVVAFWIVNYRPTNGLFEAMRSN